MKLSSSILKPSLFHVHLFFIASNCDFAQGFTWSRLCRINYARSIDGNVFDHHCSFRKQLKVNSPSENYPRNFLGLRAQDVAKNSKSEIVVLNERLWSAAELGDEQTIRILISAGAEVNSVPVIALMQEDEKTPTGEYVKGPSALHRAAENGHSNAICALVELGGNVNCKDVELCTPLHRAVVGGHLDTAQVLLTLGADPKMRDTRGRTPLAVGRESPNCPEALIDLLRALTSADDTPPDTAAPPTPPT